MISLIIISSISFGVLLIFNKKYRDYYKELLFAECKLEEVYILDRKVSKDEYQIKKISKYFLINNVKILRAYSDASSKLSLDINCVRYDKNNKGLLCIVKLYQQKLGYLQLTTLKNSPLDEYHGLKVVSYGLSLKSFLKKYHIYSSFGSETYFLENNNNGKKIIALEKFFKKQIEIVYDEDTLYFFIKDYDLDFVDSIFKPINNNNFSDKINSIKNFHKMFFDVINMFDEEFIVQ